MSCSADFNFCYINTTSYLIRTSWDTTLPSRVQGNTSSHGTDGHVEARAAARPVILHVPVRQATHALSVYSAAFYIPSGAQSRGQICCILA